MTDIGTRLSFYSREGEAAWLHQLHYEVYVRIFFGKRVQGRKELLSIAYGSFFVSSAFSRRIICNDSNLCANLRQTTDR